MEDRLQALKQRIVKNPVVEMTKQTGQTLVKNIRRDVNDIQHNPQAFQARQKVFNDRMMADPMAVVGMTAPVGAVKGLYKYVPQKGLSQMEREIETRFGQNIEKNLPQYIEKYKQLFGKVMNTDNARELSEDYMRSKETLSRAVHEPASAFIKKMHAEYLNDPTIKKYVFTGGGTGSGKTTAVNNFSREAGDDFVTWDSNMSNDSALKKVGDVVSKGKKVVIRYVHADPVVAFDRAVARALRRGRTVPINEHVNTHVGGIATIKKLVSKFKGNKNVSIDFIDNSGSKDAARLIPIEELSKIKYNKEKLFDLLDQRLETLYATGRIPRKVYEGFKTSVRPR